MKWVLSTNGMPKAVYDHRAYTKDKMSSRKGKNWGLYQCAEKRQKRCGARITIDLDTSIIVSTHGTHNCPLKIGLYEALKAGNEKIEATMKKPDISAMEIARQVNRGLSQDSKDLLPSLDNQRRNISKRIEQYYPKHPKPPKTLSEVPYRKSTESTVYFRVCVTSL